MTSPTYRIDRIVYTIPSASTPGHAYTPTVDRAGWSCQCKGYQYRQACRHIREASAGKYTTKPLVKLSTRQPIAGVSDLYGD